MAKRLGGRPFEAAAMSLLGEAVGGRQRHVEQGQVARPAKRDCLVMSASRAVALVT